MSETIKVTYLVKCDWCGEVYDGTEFCCPRCGQQEHEEVLDERSI